MSDVEIDDVEQHEPGPDHDATGGSAAPGGTSGPVTTPSTQDADPEATAARSRRARRRAATTGIGLVVALAGAAVAAQSLTAAQDREREAALAGQPNVLDAVDGPPQVLWTSPDDDVLGASVRTAEGLLVAAVQTADGSERVRAFDARTGDVAWDVELLAASEKVVLPARARFTGLGARCDDRTGDGAVVCLVSDGGAVIEGGDLRPVKPTVVRLLVLDPHDGRVTADLSSSVPASAPDLAFAVLGDLVVVGNPAADGFAVRAVASDGEIAWTTTVPSVARTTGARGDLRVRDRVLLAHTDAGAFVLDADGRTVHAVDLGPDEWVVDLAHDRLTLLTGPDRLPAPPPGTDPREVPTVSTTVVRGVSQTQGTSEVTAPGDPVTLALDDGSAPDLLLTTGSDGLRGWDREGRPAWTTDLPVTGVFPMVLDGRVLAGGPQFTVAIDPRTGDELWRTTLPGSHEGLLTDGRHLVALATLPTSTAHELVGVDRRDGTVLWRTPAPEGVDSLRSVHGVLVGDRANGVVVLGAAG